jgi:hypothetical protein
VETLGEGVVLNAADSVEHDGSNVGQVRILFPYIPSRELVATYRVTNNGYCKYSLHLELPVFRNYETRQDVIIPIQIYRFVSWL